MDDQDRPLNGVPGVCDVVLRLAAPIVPRSMRADWLREWRAELTWAARGTRVTPASPASLVLRSTGAFAHAAWLRWDRWRLDMLVEDVRQAVRAIRRRPAFSAITVLTLSLGIGANATVFSAVRAVLLRPLPFTEPDRLLRVHQTRGGTIHALRTMSLPDFVDVRHDSRTVSPIAALAPGAATLTGSGDAEQLEVTLVTGDFFGVIGVQPQFGRTLDAKDDAEHTRVVVLSHGLWMRRFGGDPNAIGRVLRLDGENYEVVGVMPESGTYPFGTALWMPLRFAAEDLLTQRGAHYLDVIGRLAPGVTLDHALAELQTLGRRLASAYPRTNRDTSLGAVSLRDALVGDFRRPLLVLLGAVALVLLIACVNVANLLLARGVDRRRELALRTALGADRGRLVQGLLVESLALAVLGGAGGLLLASWGTGGAAALGELTGIPLLDSARLDWTVVSFVAVVSLGTGILFGILPAVQWSTRLEVARGLGGGSRTTSGDRRHRRARMALIVSQTALAVVLLVGAGLLIRSFGRLTSVAPGFEPDGVVTFSLTLPESAYPSPESRTVMMRALLEKTAALPGVEGSGSVFGLPLGGVNFSISTYALDGRDLTDEERDARSLQIRVVSPDYFRAMRIPMTGGRAFSEADVRGSQPVAIVSRSAAALLWPGIAAPLGHRVTIGTTFGIQGAQRAGGEIVGLVGDVHDVGPGQAVRPTLYLAAGQWPLDYASVVVRAAGNPARLLPQLRAALRAIDANVPMYEVRTMAQLSREAVARPQFYATLLASFAGAAALLAALGLYGVLAYAVGQRTRETAVRLALGAGRGRVVGLVFGEAIRLAIAGLTIGLGAAFASARVLGSLLFGVTATDLVTYLGVAAGLLAVAALAAFLPAWRAASIDPVVALKAE